MANGSKRKSLPIADFVQHNILLFLIGFRLVNALTVQTFFQPDEYYQSLEPAWWLAFGEGSGAWITWEWKNHLRSALHPALYAVIHRIAHAVSQVLDLNPPNRAALLLAAPKTLQAFIAALGDYYTYKLSGQIYGKTSYPAWCTFWLTIGSAWQWFVSTRSFSNCVETTLTIIALYNWPFHWALGTDEVGFQFDKGVLRIRQTHPQDVGRGEGQEPDIDEGTRLRRAMLCASFATVLRPTNVIIWLTLTIATFGRGMWHHGIHWEISAFVREGLLCGGTVLTLSALVDRVFYEVWTFPLWHFFKFNVLQSLAVFYGNNNWHYYLSQGYPLLLTGAIIPAVLGLYKVVAKRGEPTTVSIQSRLVLHRLALVSITLPAFLSILSHKEVRFIYPILPALHILAALPLSRILGFPDIIGKARIASPHRNKLNSWASIILVIIIPNIIIALYTSLVHNSGIIELPNYIRTEFETHYLPSTYTTTDFSSSPLGPKPSTPSNLTFAVLMPCHSIPWRSHFQYPPTASQAGISGWALTCEPPLNLNATEKEKYKDEADIFYDDPILWLKKEMSREIPQGGQEPGVFAEQPDKRLWTNPNPYQGVWLNEGEGGQKLKGRKSGKRAWPEYLIFFGQLESTMKRALEGSRYGECKRLFNSHFHDDWRRKGDVVVWCLEPDKTTRPL